MKNFFFITPESPFYWVRACSLETNLASNASIDVKAIFHSNKIPDLSLIVFNRFSVAPFFQWIASKCISYRIPFAFDLDDIFWNLLETSQDQAKNDLRYHQQIDWFIRNASFITTTNESLSSMLHKRYANKEILQIPNALVPVAPLAGGLIVANTDNFKMGAEASSWFSKMLQSLWLEGVPVHVLGENKTLTDNCSDFYGTFTKRVDYQSYLRLLSSGSYRWGLIPVEDGPYADCKSPIKAIEFLNSGMKVLASDILPYRDFKNRYPEVAMQLVPNNQEAWHRACSSLTDLIPNDELIQNKANHLMLNDTIKNQLKAWSLAYDRFYELIDSKDMASRYHNLQKEIAGRQRLQRVANSARQIISGISRK
jgi:hypothetical protein